MPQHIVYFMETSFREIDFAWINFQKLISLM